MHGNYGRYDVNQKYFQAITRHFAFELCECENLQMKVEVRITNDSAVRCGNKYVNNIGFNLVL